MEESPIADDPVSESAKSAFNADEGEAADVSPTSVDGDSKEKEKGKEKEREKEKKNLFEPKLVKSRQQVQRELVAAGKIPKEKATIRNDGEYTHTPLNADGSEIATEKSWSPLVKWIAETLRKAGYPVGKFSPGHLRHLATGKYTRNPEGKFQDVPSPEYLYEMEPIYVEWAARELEMLIAHTKNISLTAGKHYQVKRDDIVKRLRNLDVYLEYEAQAKARLKEQEEQQNNSHPGKLGSGTFTI